jgi:hypothetical protein
MGRKPAIWTPVDRRYEALRIGMQDLFRRTRHHDRRRIDNNLSIMECQVG